MRAPRRRRKACASAEEEGLRKSRAPSGVRAEGEGPRKLGFREAVLVRVRR